jgi:hypothetical protein
VIAINGVVQLAALEIGLEHVLDAASTMLVFVRARTPRKYETGSYKGGKAASSKSESI